VSLSPEPAAWAQTILVFGEAQLSIDLRAPVDEAARQALVDLGLAQPFAIITPCNPYGWELDEATNTRRLTDFEQALLERDLQTVPAEGRSPDATHREPGWALVIPRDEAVVLARRWGQLGLYWWDGTAFEVVMVPEEVEP
jgi:hypothetical protein